MEIAEVTKGMILTRAQWRKWIPGDDCNASRYKLCYFCYIKPSVGITHLYVNNPGYTVNDHTNGNLMCHPHQVLYTQTSPNIVFSESQETLTEM